MCAYIGGSIIKKVISGGQTGADIAGLQAARYCGIKTGGTAPLGWITSNGPNLDLGVVYGLVEGEQDNRIYPKRTSKNVENSDGTVIFFYKRSAGIRLTIRECALQNKSFICNPTQILFARWIKSNKIKILNVAGNAASEYDIDSDVYCFLIQALR